jgi:HEAT repeat protein
VTSGRKLKLVATVLAALTATACFRADAQTKPTSSPAELIASDLTALSAMLNDPQAPRDQREEAARRLLSRATPESRKILNDALVNLTSGSALAVVRALADDQRPDPELVNPLFAALVENRSSEFTRACAAALANYKDTPNVLARLIGTVQHTPPYAEAVRRETISALGKLVDKRAAEVLVGLATSPAEQPRIRLAATDALVDMTGLTEFGQNFDQWAAWWAPNARKSDMEFRNDVLPRRAARNDQIHQRWNDLVEEVRRTYTTRYRTAAAPQQPEILLSYLRSTSPEVRTIGAGIARDEVAGNKPLPASVRDQLRYMIGDSDPAVRLGVANALAKINDPASLAPLLTQLAQESDADVRASLAEALGPINDLQAVPALLRLLSDASKTAATRAAQALELLGPKIRAESPDLAKQTADALRQALAARPPGAANNDVRAAMVDAMTPLKQEQLLQDPLYLMLRPRPDESPDIRRRVLKAIGTIGNPQSAPRIATYLEDDEPLVRLWAVRAMGNMPTAYEYAEPLFRRMDPTVERDASVQDEAWLVFQTVLPALSIERLNSYAARFQSHPQHQFVVQAALEDKLKAANNQPALADLWENMGETLMKPENNDPRNAAVYVRQALDFKKNIPNIQPVVLVRLRENLMRALLRSRQYREAVQFAADSIRENVANTGPMGGYIRAEAERLRDDNDLEGATQLIQETKTMSPPLADPIPAQLADIESQIKRKMQERSGPAGSAYTEAATTGTTTNPSRMVIGR